MARLARLTLLSAALLLAPAAAQAATPPTTGTVAGAKGWTVLALAPDGRAASVRTSAAGTFRLVAAKGTTLQLVRPSGAYFGPVALGRPHGGRVSVALSGRGGALGRIVLRKGFAGAPKADARSVAKGTGVHADRHGAPVGAGHLGLVAAHGARARAAAAGPAAGLDPDADGIPSPMDADDDGDGVPDSVDSSSGEAGAGLFSEVQVLMENSLNANATGASPAAIDAFVRQYLALDFWLDGHQAKGAKINAVDVDCLGLTYCRGDGGTGTVSMSGNTAAGLDGRTWSSLDDNGDGFPDVPASAQQPGVFSIQIHPSVPTAQIAPGDIFQVHYRTSAGDVVAPTALTLYFLTSTAAAALDGQPIAYPATPQTLGAHYNPVRLSGDSLRVELWRPQRAALPGETGDLVDQGHLHYGVPVQVDNREIGCGPEAYGALSPTLRATAGGDMGSRLFPLLDTADDAAPTPARRIAFSFDIGGCLRSNGIDPAGKLVPLPLTAVDEGRPGGMDRASQLIWVCLPGCTVPAQSGPQDQGPGTPGQQPGGPGPQGQGPSGGGDGGKADLSPDTLSATADGGDCRLSWNVGNRGTATASPSVTAVHVIGGAGAADTEVPLESLDPNASRTQSTTVSGACAGRTVRVVVDARGTVDEFHDDNNELQQAV
jgi:hypothetical protein